MSNLENRESRSEEVSVLDKALQSRVNGLHFTHLLKNQKVSFIRLILPVLYPPSPKQKLHAFPSVTKSRVSRLCRLNKHHQNIEGPLLPKHG